MELKNISRTRISFTLATTYLEKVPKKALPGANSRDQAPQPDVRLGRHW